LVAVLDLALLAFQLPFEERELRERFGVPYRRDCELVPRVVPRRARAQVRSSLNMVEVPNTLALSVVGFVVDKRRPPHPICWLLLGGV